MSDDGRPDPLFALREAASECGIVLPERLLEQVLQLESDLNPDATVRSQIKAALRRLIESEAGGQQ